jgi:hypothetical protein
MRIQLFALLLVTVAASARPQGLQWPHPVPCRINDGANPDIFLMTLGNVTTPLANATFDPVADRVVFADGRVFSHYYRDSLHVKFYAPIDKSIFPLPPSGWCSWYYYYQEIDPAEVMKNAHWVASTLKPFGAQYIQIDDGWQGTGHGLGENRDWSTIDKRFAPGMTTLTAEIRKLGLTPGLWLAPHGQSNAAVVRANPGVFLLRSDDSSASDTWEGTYLVDPSTQRSREYLRNLFTTLAGWGFDYFKIDGQPIVVDEYRAKKSFMKGNPEDPDRLYRGTLGSIRAAIGPNRYLLGCWGTPIEGAGIMNGSRTGGDVVPAWDGFRVALAATMRWFFLHNIVWYCDPDVMLLRTPLSLDQARAWATLQGLTGQALMASDRLPDLPEERVEIMKRVFPAVDIRPLDLYPSQRDKKILDLKINRPGLQYDVVGLFNYDEHASNDLLLRWSDVGLPDTGAVHVFDFWNQEYIGAWEKGLNFHLSPTSCRAVALVPDNRAVTLVSTNRHITQGWIDLLEESFDSRSLTYTGRSRVVAGDPYELRFAFHRGTNYRIISATAGDLQVAITNHQGWATIRTLSPREGDVRWRVTFEPAEVYHFPVHTPYGLSVDPAGLDAVRLTWSAQYYLTAGYEVSLDGWPLGATQVPSFPLRGLDPRKQYAAAVRSIWEDGTRSPKQAEITFSPLSMVPPEIVVSELEPVRATVGWGNVGINKSVASNPLSIGGRKFQRGLGTHATSDIEYHILGLYGKFSSWVGVDDGNESEKGSVEFIVIGDGRELWRSGIMHRGDPARTLEVSVAGVERLILRVMDGGDGIDYDHADWCSPMLRRAE